MGDARADRGGVRQFQPDLLSAGFETDGHRRVVGSMLRDVRRTFAQQVDKSLLDAVGHDEPWGGLHGDVGAEVGEGSSSVLQGAGYAGMAFVGERHGGWLFVANDAQNSADVRKSLIRAVTNRADGLISQSGIIDAFENPCVHRHEGHVVGDDVVQFVRDPFALRNDGSRACVLELSDVEREAAFSSMRRTQSPPDGQGDCENESERGECRLCEDAGAYGGEDRETTGGDDVDCDEPDRARVDDQDETLEARRKMVLMDAKRDRATTAGGKTLSRAALKYENLRTLSAVVPVVALLIAGAVWVTIDWVVFVALWILLPLCVLSALIDIVVVNRLQFRAYRYTIDRSTVEIRHGLFWRSRTTISTVQILSVDVVQGPLLRSCGLASIVFRTVGGTIKLGPVTPDTAEGIRAQVMRALETGPR